MSTPPPPQQINTDTWLNQVVTAAMDLRASDMLLRTNATGEVLTCDIRIDGRMRPFQMVRGAEARVIVGRFKAQSNLASGGSFRPEETIHEVTINGEPRKARVALFRKADGGDAIVMRLPPTGKLRTLDELKFSERNLTLFRELLTSSNRMVMVAGPMGSGKTTTAHGALLEVADRTKTVWTIEDPVERILPGLVQLEVDEENGAGFDELLKTLVRSDYDTLFLGEIRDKSTASAGVKQAKAGRQVISTIHANDNVTALLRLLELSDESPLSVLDSVRGVVSQRLVAQLNPAWDGNNAYEKYQGRLPVHEVLFITEELVEAVMAQRPLGEIREIAARRTMSTFEQDAERLLAGGLTDEEEITRSLGFDLDKSIASTGAATVHTPGPAVAHAQVSAPTSPTPAPVVAAPSYQEPTSGPFAQPAPMASPTPVTAPGPHEPGLVGGPR